MQCARKGQYMSINLKLKAYKSNEIARCGEYSFLAILSLKAFVCNVDK